MSDVKNLPATELPWELQGSMNSSTMLLGKPKPGFALQYGQEVARIELNGVGMAAPYVKDPRYQDARYIHQAVNNYPFLVRALKAELAEHEEKITDEICRDDPDAADYHRERAGGIRALLTEMGEL